MLVEAAETNRAAFDRDVDMLVGHARSLNYRGFVQAMAYWRYLNEAEAEEAAAAGRDAGRRVYCSETFGGGWDLTGWLGAVGGTVVANELARLERQLFDDDVREEPFVKMGLLAAVLTVG